VVASELSTVAVRIVWSSGTEGPQHSTDIYVERTDNYELAKSSFFNVNKNPTDSKVCRYLFTAKLLYMFRVSQHPSSGVLKTVPAASGTGHNTCAVTPLERDLIGTGLCESTRLAQTSPDQTTLEGSSGTSSMTCTGGCMYSF